MAKLPRWRPEIQFLQQNYEVCSFFLTKENYTINKPGVSKPLSFVCVSLAFLQVFEPQLVGVFRHVMFGMYELRQTHLQKTKL